LDWPKSLKTGALACALVAGLAPASPALAEDATPSDLSAGQSVVTCDDKAASECLLAEVHALLLSAPEVDRKAERWGATGPSEAGRQIAILLAKAGHFEEAAKIAEAIADPNAQARAIRDVVLVHLRTEGPDPAKRLEDVHTVISKISSHPAIAAELATEIAIWLAEQGDKDGALEIFAKAEQVAAYIGDEGQKGRALAFITSEYMELGEVDRAKGLIDQIEDEFWRAAGLRIISTLLAEAGDFAGAEAVVASIDDEEKEERNKAYVRLAESLANAGQLDEAQRIIGRIADETDQGKARAKFAAALAKGDQATAGVDFATAQALALELGDPEDQAKAFAALALRLVAIGQFDDVEALAARLVKTDASASTISSGLENIAQSLWEAGQKAAATRHIKEAERFAALIEDPEDKADRFREIAKLYIAFGQYAEAERVAVGIEDVTHRVFALTDPGVALAGDGQIAEMTRLVSVIGAVDGAENWRGDGLAQIAKALAAEGEVATAEAVAEGIVEPSWRANAMADVVAALAEGGQLFAAERIARQIEDPAWRAVALAAVACRL
jgi:tetratricopeptide (TPR) repeat protein